MNPKNSTIIALCLVAIAGGIALMNQRKGDTARAIVPGKAGDTRVSDRQGVSVTTERPGGIASPESAEALAARTELALVERDKMTAMWMKNAAGGFQHTRKNLVADLNLSDEEAAKLARIFTRRDQELAELLAKMSSGEAEDDKEVLRNICALIRNKGLREDLAGVLTKEKLEAYDAKEAKRERETVEARAYRDMAEISSVVQLSDAQKQQALGVLMKRAPEKVEQEADARAFMTLTYGPLANEMESAGFRGLANLITGGLMNEGISPDTDIASLDYQNRIVKQKAERIEGELSALSNVLDERQLARYREHLEAEPPW